MMHGRKFGPGGPRGGRGRGWNPEVGQKFARAFAEAAFEGAVGKRRGRMFRRGELRLVLLHLMTLMAEMDLIDETVDQEGKKIYAITEAGKARLAEEQPHIDEILARLDGVSKMGEASDGASIRRAMHNLKSAVRIRLASEEKGSDKILDVAAIIDEAASRIERLK